jgi:hypothetical protein
VVSVVVVIAVDTDVPLCVALEAFVADAVAVLEAVEVVDVAADEVVDVAVAVDATVAVVVAVVALVVAVVVVVAVDERATVASPLTLAPEVAVAAVVVAGVADVELLLLPVLVPGDATVPPHPAARSATIIEVARGDTRSS